MIDRRTLIAAPVAATLAASIARSASAAPAAARFPIWPGAAPGMPTPAVVDAFVKRSPTGAADDIAWPHVATPMLTVSPAAAPTGGAVLMIPGGGYSRVAIGREPSTVARWFASQGITAFELLYRLPHDHWAAGPDTSLQDAQRAMRVIRSRAATWGIDPASVATIGFSAGGHVAARLASRASLATYAPVDAADRLSARPVAAGLMFPVITMMGPLAHPQSRRELLGTNPDDATAARYSAENDLPADMPPTLLGHAADDATVKAANSIRMFEALQAAAIPSELYIIEKGGHGAPLLKPDGSANVWLQQYLVFAGRHGLKVRP
ncbi:alpha/beta hydrolase [Sphingomonas sp. R86521]|uniref:alpha/beta hydrolase n=1 Tax=Sphingomonas sp. R86521 TaxID=3093860 RepID=UPI0036D4259C